MNKSILFAFAFIFLISFTSATLTVTLNSPTNASTQYINLISTNYSLNVVNGTYLTNTTRYVWFTNGTLAYTNSSIIENQQIIDNGKAIDGSGTGNSADKGVKINVGPKKIKVYAVNTATPFSGNIIGCAIKDSSLSTTYGTGTISNTGGWCNFSTPVVLNNGTTYYLLIQGDGGSWSDRTGSTTFPIQSGLFNWTAGRISSGDSSNRYSMIRYVNATALETSYLQNYTNNYDAGTNLKWNAQGCDSDGGCIFATSNFTFNIDAISPQLFLNYPNGLVNYGFVGGALQLNITATDSNLANVWYDYNGTNVTTHQTITTSSTSSGLNTITEKTGVNFTAVNDFYLSNVTFFSQSTGTKAYLWYSNGTQIKNTTISGQVAVFNTQLNKGVNYSVSIDNSGSNYVVAGRYDDFTYPINRGDISFYNGFGCNVGSVCLASVKELLSYPTFALSNITLSTKKNVTIYANDTAGNLNTTTFSWDYLLFGNSVNYNATTTTTSSETFSIVGQKDSSISTVSAYLWYDGTAHLSTVNMDGNNVNITNTFEIPAGTASRNFFWAITMFGTGGYTYVNTTNLTQTVSNLSLAYCVSPSTTGLTLNFTTYDTSTSLAINSTFEATFYYYAAGGSGAVLETYTYSNLTQNRSNYMFCLNSSGKNVTLDAFISYGKTGYDTRQYILDNAIIGNFTQTIPLYLTATSLTDIVTITVQDQGYNPLEGALVTIQKWVVGTNTYPTIGMFTTSSTGQGIMDLELYNTWYRATVTYNGVIVKVTDVQKLSGTSWPITVTLGVDNPYDLFGTVTHGLVLDNVTNITTFSWVDTSGYVQQGCLTVKNSTSLGYVTVYSSCVSSVAGTINYQLAQNSTYMIYGTVYLNPSADNVSQITDTLFVDLGGPSQLTAKSSPFGKVISMIAIGVGAGVGIAAGSPILGGIVSIVIIFGIWKMGWIVLSEQIFWSVLIVIVVVIFRQTRRGG